ncbi:glutathione S-transferase family protein, partial [Escherichia coli]|uniref:glutathione S-transferase family protein n=1 Tax=Escherichia coli TaxID=562 RepID=UPI00227F6D8D
EAIEFSGQKLVPVLVHGDHVISDSWQIACYLEDTFPERPSLFGGDTGRALSLFANSWADTTLVPTLARLLLRFFDPAAGRITLGGVDLRRIETAQLYRRIGFVLQEVRLIHASIHDNIALGRSAASRQ